MTSLLIVEAAPGVYQLDAEVLGGRLPQYKITWLSQGSDATTEVKLALVSVLAAPPSRLVAFSDLYSPSPSRSMYLLWGIAWTTPHISHYFETVFAQSRHLTFSHREVL